MAAHEIGGSTSLILCLSPERTSFMYVVVCSGAAVFRLTRLAKASKKLPLSQGVLDKGITRFHPAPGHWLRNSRAAVKSNRISSRCFPRVAPHSLQLQGIRNAWNTSSAHCKLL